jgi:ankyrin repeat protein
MKTGLFVKCIICYAVVVLVGLNAFHSHGQNHYFQTNDPESELLMAVYDQDLQRVKELVAAGVNVNTRDYAGISALAYAVMGENDQIAWFLIAEGANVNILDYTRRSILMHALIEARDHWVEQLLPLIENVNHQDMYGYTALIFACQNDNVETVIKLVDAGAEVHTLTQAQTTTLMHAVAFGQFFIADYLLEQGVQVNHQSIDGSTALHLAAWYGQYEIAGLLLEWGADPEIKDAKGNTPLLSAVINNQPYMVWYLIESGASLQAVNNQGYSAFSLASALKSKEIYELLLQYEFIEPRQGGKRQSALAYAYYTRNDHLARQLITSDKIAPRGLYFSEVWLQQGFDFNANDLMYTPGISLYEARYRLLFSFNYLVRIGHRKLLVRQPDDNLYQFFEKRHSLNFSAGREFDLFNIKSGIKWGVLPGLEGRYTFAGYRGTGYEAPGGWGFSPLISLYSHWRYLTLTAGYNIFKTGQGQISLYRYRIALSLRIPFFKKEPGADYVPVIN